MRRRVRRTVISRAFGPKVELEAAAEGRVLVTLAGYTGDGFDHRHEFVVALQEWHLRLLVKDIRKAFAEIKTTRAQRDADNEKAFLP